MKRFLFLISTVMISLAQAEISYSMPALEAGFKWSAMDSTATGGQQSLGWTLGGSLVLNFSQQLGLKTGLLYNERPFKFDSGVEGKMTYADIPFQLMLKLEDYAGLYFGPTVSMKISHESKNTVLTDVKGMIIPLTFGGQFKFTPNLGANLFFEMVSGELASGLKDSKGIGASLLVAFD